MDTISRFDPANAQKAHGDTILAGPVLPEGLLSPFDHAWGYLNGPGAMEEHKHHKEEVYVFTNGNGFVVVDGTRYPVGPGDVAYIPPNAPHSVVNESEEELKWAVSGGISPIRWLRVEAKPKKKTRNSAMFSTTGRYSKRRDIAVASFFNAYTASTP